MAGFQCPYCMHLIAANETSHSRQYPSFYNPKGYDPMQDANSWYDNTCVELNFYRCPNCNQTTISAIGRGKEVKDVNVQIRPLSKAKIFPNYIPTSIRKDYEEACAIVNLSPKASATLSRRCLQGMIRDYWNISGSTLYKEIDALSDKIPSDLWSSINALRQLGNIGAHMEKDTDVIIDIDPNEANTLIQLIELLMKEWYINREERTRLFATIQSTNESKQAERKNTE